MPNSANSPKLAPEISGEMLRGVFGLVIGLSFATSLFAAPSARGLFQDGVYYLYRMAVSDGFQLVDPARTTVQALRQAPIVLLTRYTDLSLFARGQVFTFVLLFLPAAICAPCWLIAPHGRKGWILFPLAYLVVGVSATSFNAIGEAAPAASIWWCLMFLLVFRTREPLSQLLFLGLCACAAFMHEGAFALMLVLLLGCGLRWSEAKAIRDRLFLLLSALTIGAILVYELSWVIHPRVPEDRTMVLDGLRSLEFIVRDGHLNLPLAIGFVACVALGALVLVEARLPPANARVWKRRIVAGFCAACVLAMLSLFLERSFSPGSQVLARYHPVFVSFGLGLAMLAFYHFGVPERVWLQPGSLVIIAALALVQASAEVAATIRWQAHVADLRSRLSTAKGLVPWNDTLVTGDAEKDMNWRLMSMEWVIPLMSIAYAKDGVVRAMIDPRPQFTFRPVDPNKPDRLPVLRGIDFAPYRAAMTGR